MTNTAPGQLSFSECKILSLVLCYFISFCDQNFFVLDSNIANYADDNA